MPAVVAAAAMALVLVIDHGRRHNPVELADTFVGGDVAAVVIGFDGDDQLALGRDDMDLDAVQGGQAGLDDGHVAGAGVDDCTGNIHGWTPDVWY